MILLDTWADIRNLKLVRSRTWSEGELPERTELHYPPPAARRATLT